MRRRYKGTAEMPRIGFGTDRAYRYRHNDGMYRVNVSTLKDIEMLMMQNRRYAAVINHNVSFRLRPREAAGGEGCEQGCPCEVAGEVRERKGKQ